MSEKVFRKGAEVCLSFELDKQKCYSMENSAVLPRNVCVMLHKLLKPDSFWFINYRISDVTNAFQTIQMGLHSL